MTRERLAPTIEHHVVNSLGWNDLRPLQKLAIEPIRSGADCLLIAPTAGGKTEATFFPLLSGMSESRWQGMSVLYVAPLRALLNNVYPRIARYAEWLGMETALWHGDVGQSERKRIRGSRPEILLTTPESLESMLVSRTMEHEVFFSQVRCVVVDELHSFAAGDRGWHLLAVLERITQLARGRVQRIGLSATVGNPEALLRWLQGAANAQQRREVVLDESGIADPELTVDIVGSLKNAATVISRLHRGEKRLAFLEARADVEEIAYELRELDVETHVSHSSISAEERRESERAFAEGRDCVIASTSTLELGIDIGDLDRVLQIGAPATVSAFLQRLGRSGRRAGTRRNMLFLATGGDTLLQNLGILLLSQRDYIEPVAPPAAPKHIVAQQLLALALQEGAFPVDAISKWWNGLGFMEMAPELLEFLVRREFLATDGAQVFIGPNAEEHFGNLHFRELLSSFTSAFELTVKHGERVIGFIPPDSVIAKNDQAVTQIILAGLSWNVEEVDWDRFVVEVTPAGTKGESNWMSDGAPISFDVMRAQRDVLLGAAPEVQYTRRALDVLAGLRIQYRDSVHDRGLVMEMPSEMRTGREPRLWTWAGKRANRAVLLALGVQQPGEIDPRYVNLPASYGAPNFDALRSDAPGLENLVREEAAVGLKFSAALPIDVARRTLALRLLDVRGARAVLEEPWIRWHPRSEG